MVKPLVFAESPQPAKKDNGPKPLSFSVAHAPATPPVSTKPAAEPKPLFGESRSPLTVDALRVIETNSAELFRKHKPRFELQVSQLLPVKIETIMSWGSKTMERMRIASTEAAKLTSEFVTMDGTKMLDAAVKSVQPSTGFLGRFTQQKPTDYEPQIAVLMTSLDMWMKQCTSLLDKARTNLEESLIKMLSLSAVYDTVGEPSDQGLAQALYNRRVMLQQGATQAELVVRQLESINQQMIDQRMRSDQILNVTIPAWKSAAANK